MSYANVGYNKGGCYECLAGLSRFPFEDFTDSPQWLATIGAEVPWNQAGPLAQVPHKAQESESFFVRDPFHLYKQTMGGHFCASVVVLLGDLGHLVVPNHPDGNSVESFLGRASYDFDYFARHEWKGRVRPNLKHFTGQILHFSHNKAFPYGRFKGSDRMLMTRWIRCVCEHGPVFDGDITRSGQGLIHDPGYGHVWRLVADMCAGILTFFHLLHTNGLWPAPNTLQQMANGVRTFCVGYSRLASWCYGQGLTRFQLQPSLHSLYHYYFELRNRPSTYINPAADSCEADEDFIGRTARLTKAVHPGTVTIRTLQRHQTKCCFEYENDSG